ncbi:hypothetical protein JZ751_025314 [Albula glossodonta]|uniref:Uncharacterized protein n=1 Tax=Albula glossodonta TaxID=121402 RepID=A0A8T2NFT8_9TELE|nr:hypothetical protein JZ751_025314 [Albula glossodonta]
MEAKPLPLPDGKLLRGAVYPARWRQHFGQVLQGHMGDAHRASPLSFSLSSARRSRSFFSRLSSAPCSSGRRTRPAVCAPEERFSNSQPDSSAFS